MLGFFSSVGNDNEIVTSNEIMFVSCDNNLSESDIKISFAQMARAFADKFNLNKVYLHFGKEKIIYEYES